MSSAAARAHDTPWPVAPGVWTVEGGPQHVLGMPFPLRMTVARLPDGGLWLHSPIPHDPTLHAALTALGPIRHLVAPDTAHWLHVAGWQAACPDAALWTAPGVGTRAAKQGTTLRVTGELDATPPAAWGDAFALARFTAPGFDEIAFHHRPSATLILTDTIQALDPAPLPWAMRLFVRLVGAAGPEGGTPRQLRLLLNRRRAANQVTARRLLDLAPERVIFAHGDWYERDGAARLGRAFAWLVA